MKSLIALISSLLIVSFFFTTIKDTIFLLSNVKCRNKSDQVVATHMGATCLSLIAENPYVVSCVLGNGVARDYKLINGRFIGSMMLNCTDKVVCFYQATEKRCVPNIDLDYWNVLSSRVVVFYMAVIFLLYSYYLITKDSSAASHLHSLITSFTSIEKMAIQGVKLCNPITGRGAVIQRGCRFVVVGTANKVDSYLEGGVSESMMFEEKLVVAGPNYVRFIEGVETETILISSGKARNNSSYLHLLTKNNNYAAVDQSLKHYHDYEETKKIMTDESLYFCFSVADRTLNIRGKDDRRAVLMDLVKDKGIVDLLMSHFELFNEKLGDKKLSLEGLMTAARKKLMWHDKPSSWGSTYWKKYSSDVVRIFSMLGKNHGIKNKKLVPSSLAYEKAVSDYSSKPHQQPADSVDDAEEIKYKARLSVQVQIKEPEPIQEPKNKILYNYNVETICCKDTGRNICPAPTGMKVVLEGQEDSVDSPHCLDELRTISFRESYKNCITRERFLSNKKEHDRLQRETLKKMIERGEIIFKYRKCVLPDDFEEPIKYSKVVKVNGKKVKTDFVKYPKKPGHEVARLSNRNFITREYISIEDLTGLKNYLISQKSRNRSMNRFSILASHSEGLLDLEGMPKESEAKNGDNNPKCLSEFEIDVDLDLKKHIKSHCLKFNGANRLKNIKSHRKVVRMKKNKKAIKPEGKAKNLRNIFAETQEYTTVRRLDRKTLCPFSAAEQLVDFKVESKGWGLVANIKSIKLLGDESKESEVDKYYKGPVSKKDYRYMLAGELESTMAFIKKSIVKQRGGKAAKGGEELKQDTSKLGMIDLSLKNPVAEASISKHIEEEYKQSEIDAMYDHLIEVCDNAIAESTNV